MVKFCGTWILMICLLFNAIGKDVIRINQMGYLPDGKKIAVFISDKKIVLLKDSCHTADGIVVDHPYKSGKWIDVTGGWHDASDYLQYVLTSTNEPTMDGTASLSYLLSSLEASKPEKTEIGRTVDKQGAIVRMNQAEKKI